MCRVRWARSNFHHFQSVVFTDRLTTFSYFKKSTLTFYWIFHLMLSLKKLLDKNNFSAGYWQRKVRKMASFVDVDVVFINKIATPSDFETEFLISFSYWKINWIKQPIIWSSKELTNVGRWVMIFFSRYFTVPFAVINFWFFENSWIFQGLS